MEELTFSAIGFLSMGVVGVGFSDLPKKKSFILPNRPLDDWEEGAGEDCGAQRTCQSDEVLDELFEPKGK